MEPNKDSRRLELQKAFEAGILSRATYMYLLAGLESLGAIIVHGNSSGNLNTGIQINNNRYEGPDPKDVAEARRIYLAVLARMVSRLPMKAFDANQSNPNAQTRELSLMSVYTDLDTRQTVDMSLEDGVVIGRTPEPRHPGREVPDRRRLRALEAVARSRHVALLGDPGSGKSSFVNHLIFCLAQPRVETDGSWRDAFEQDWPVAERDSLPIRIILRDFAAWLNARKINGGATVARISEFLAHTVTEQNVPLAHKALISALDSGEALLVFDGLDEVTTYEKRIFIRDVVGALKERYSESRIVVTCRTGSYLPPENPRVEDLRFTNFPTVELAPFDDFKIGAFIDAWHTELADHGERDKVKAALLRPLLHAAVGKPDLRRLAENPLQLTLMAWVHTHDEELPTNRAKLYSRCVELLLWEWENTKRGIGAATLKELAAKIDNGRPAIKRELCQAAFIAHEGLGEPRKDEDAEELADISESELKTALARLKLQPNGKPDANWAGDVVDAIKLRSGLLAQRLPNVLTFPHRTFQEYLAGLWLLQKDFIDQAFVRAAQPGLWREAILLAVGQTVYVDERLELPEPLALVRRLCPPDPVDEPDGWKRVAVAGDILCECGIDLAQKRDRATFDTVRAGLRRLIEGHKLTPVERARVADTLARLGDPRFDPARHHLPIGDDLGFVKIEPDPDFRIGTRSKDVDRIVRDLRIDRDLLTREINDEITPTDAFYIARYPVTVAQFRAFASATNIKLGNPDALRDPDTRPMLWVSWHEAMAYCDWLGAQIRKAPAPVQTPIAALLRSGKWRLTLPTEREWEKSARGDQVAANYPWGDTPNPTLANYDDTGIRTTSAVGVFPPNAFGLYDMVGNAWEWTHSWYFPYEKKYDNGRDALEAQKGEYNRVLRGGAFHDSESGARCANRDGNQPGRSDDNTGFRILVSPIH